MSGPTTAICAIPNCGRRAPADEAFCSHHREMRGPESPTSAVEAMAAAIAAIRPLANLGASLPEHFEPGHPRHQYEVNPADIWRARAALDGLKASLAALSQAEPEGRERGAVPTSAPTEQMAAEGWRWLPREPTEAMLLAANEASLSTEVLMNDTRFACERATYVAAWDAAPVADALEPKA